jgi:hypothetical protein
MGDLPEWAKFVVWLTVAAPCYTVGLWLLWRMSSKR